MGNGNGNGNGNKLTKHHINPASRLKENGGDLEVDTGEDNITYWYHTFHFSWNDVFGNLTVAEAHRLIDLVNVPGTSWGYKALEKLREGIKEGAL